MKGFQKKIVDSAVEHKSRVVLALDIIEEDSKRLLQKAESLLRRVSRSISAIKINYHILLPLSIYSETSRIVNLAHQLHLQVIGDLKLNDIASTNSVAARYLWSAGFDAVIVNPFVGFEGGLKPTIEEAKGEEKGVLALIYMSHIGAREGYGLTVRSSGEDRDVKMYELLLSRAISWGVDGVIVGATNPSIIRIVADRVERRMLIFSPGVGVQGGVAKECLESGADFIMVGRSILNAEDPESIAESIRRETWIPFSD